MLGEVDHARGDLSAIEMEDEQGVFAMAKRALADLRIQYYFLPSQKVFPARRKWCWWLVAGRLALAESVVVNSLLVLE